MNRNGTESARAASRQRDKDDTPNVKSPDPSHFEPEFAIAGEDDSVVSSRVGTPVPQVEGATANANAEAAAPQNEVYTQREERRPVGETENGASGQQRGNNAEQWARSASRSPAATSSDLPTEVRVKLRKLERLEGRYQELLKAYKTAHSRVQQIEPFEASLRENTPLTGISDPSALVEYLNQTSLKSDMVLDELKRVTTDRDTCQKKLEESEKLNGELRSEISRLNSDKVARIRQAHSDTASLSRPSLEVNTNTIGPDPAPALKSPTGSVSSRVPSFSIFSPKSKAKSPPPKETSEEFFSYDSELPRLESELQERQTEVADLKVQVEKLKGDLAVTRESTGSMVESLETATRELHALREAKDKFSETKSELQSRIDELQARAEKSEQHSDRLERQVKQLQSERDDAHHRFLEAESRVETLKKDVDDSVNSLRKQEQLAEMLNEKLGQKDATTKDLEDTLAMYKSAERQESKRREERESDQNRIATMQNIIDQLRAQLQAAEATIEESRQELSKKREEFSKRISTKVFGFLDEETPIGTQEKLETRNEVIHFLADKFSLRSVDQSGGEDQGTVYSTQTATEATASGPSNKKKNKKKRKGKTGPHTETTDAINHDGPVKVTEDLADVEDAAQAPASGAASNDTSISVLRKEIIELKNEIERKTTTITRLSDQIKDQEALQEEVETLRDDLLHQGEEHVEARDELKKALMQKKSLESTVEAMEKELAELRGQLEKGAEPDQTHNDLLQQFEDLRMKATELQTELAAAEALASTRFKDLTELKDLLAKAQPELKSLRTEVSELRPIKEELRNKLGELKRLEGKHEDLKSEMKGLSKRLGDKDAEIKELNSKLEQEVKARIRAEEEAGSANNELKYVENRRSLLAEERDNLSQELTKVKAAAEEMSARVRSLEDQTQNHANQVLDLREEINLKAALHATSQSLVQSLRDQMHELSTQAREAGSRAESLEEELAEAQRLLSERTRESQTMRMLLSQAETGTESRLRDMRERMEAAVEERDRIEDDASVSNRRMMREVEEGRARIREMQRAMRALEEEKEAWDGKQREWKTKRIELESARERANVEIAEVRSAMISLREALDLAESQIRDLESQRGLLRKEIDDGKERVEKLLKSNKALSEELKTVQHPTPRKINPKSGSGLESGVQSSRSSFDSTSVSARSPVPSSAGTKDKDRPRSETPTGPHGGTLDYVYLKNVLLQFLEQKDKNHQKQLIPVLAMLLHFDRKDEQKWMAAVGAR